MKEIKKSKKLKKQNEKIEKLKKLKNLKIFKNLKNSTNNYFLEKKQDTYATCIERSTLMANAKQQTKHNKDK